MTVKEAGHFGQIMREVEGGERRTHELKRETLLSDRGHTTTKALPIRRGGHVNICPERRGIQQT